VAVVLPESICAYNLSVSTRSCEHVRLVGPYSYTDVSNFGQSRGFLGAQVFDDGLLSDVVLLRLLEAVVGQTLLPSLK